VFLVNNFDQIIGLFVERKVASEQTAKFSDLLASQREVFVEEELKGSYGRMIAFVKQTEAASSAGQALNLDSNLVEGLVRNFATTWKAGIETINKVSASEIPQQRRADLTPFFAGHPRPLLQLSLGHGTPQADPHAAAPLLHALLRDHQARVGQAAAALRARPRLDKRHSFGD
jgi:hypothetical protein